MKIAFDFDGVVRYHDLGLLKLCLTLDSEFTRKEYIEADKIHTMITPPLINPLLFATKDDEVYVISNCLSPESAMKKASWLKHFFGDRIKFIYTSINPTSWKREYCDSTAKAKVQVMLEEGIEVYFDDDPAIIRVMRTLTDKIKFIKYGPWIEEYY